MKSLMVACVLCGIAGADPSTAKLSPADQKTYNAALTKGGQLEDAKKYDDALAAFNDALAVAADDPTVLAEMGWTSYLKKDYDNAEKYTRRALANQSTPNIRGAAYYNLGLIQEKKSDSAGAIKSYSESLKARWNTTVRAALARLAPAAVAALDPFKPQPLSGPFKSIDDYCKHQPATEPSLPGYADAKCTCSRDDAAKHSDAAAPFEAFDWVTETCNVTGTAHGSTSYSYAVKVGGGWYVGGIAGSDTNRYCGDNVTTQEVRIEQGRAVFRVVEDGSCEYSSSGTKFTEDQLAAVAIGPSGKPSGTPAFMAVRHEEEFHYDDNYNAGPSTVTTDIKLEVTWTKSGVVFKGNTKGGDDRMIGTHPLTFP